MESFGKNAVHRHTTSKLTGVQLFSIEEWAESSVSKCAKAGRDVQQTTCSCNGSERWFYKALKAFLFAKTWKSCIIFPSISWFHTTLGWHVTWNVNERHWGICPHMYISGIFWQSQDSEEHVHMWATVSNVACPEIFTSGLSTKPIGSQALPVKGCV